LTTGAKVAIGCGVALLLAGIVCIVLVGAGAYWVKGKTEDLVAGEKKIDELKKKANANAFTKPPTVSSPSPASRRSSRCASASMRSTRRTRPSSTA
jgi:hypothetical protein